MPKKIASFEPTPNPDALKCVLAQPLSPPANPALLTGRPRSYRSIDDAREAGDDLGGALMAVEGVSSVLIRPAFVTVVRTPGAKWPPIRRAVETALVNHDGGLA